MTEPAGPVAVNVYTVVWAGETVTDPDGDCEPTPLSMDTAVALDVDHDNVVDWPAVIEGGDAEKVSIPGNTALADFVAVNDPKSPNESVSVPVIVSPLMLTVN